MPPFYAPKGMYAWDFWLVNVDDECHLFHLQAPRSLRPSQRHHHATVGHATSKDLEHWKYHGTVLTPGRRGEWDDQCIWTGSIIEHYGQYYFLYTGRKRGDFLIQRIGVAVTDDLFTFEKSPANPVLEADGEWYQTANATGLKIEDWRDPYLCVLDGVVHAYITARTKIPAGISKSQLRRSYLKEYLRLRSPYGRIRSSYPTGPLAGRGCIAKATSPDLLTWEVHPPVLAPGRYGMLECPQHIHHDGHHYLTFSTLEGWYHRDWAERIGGGQTGLHAYYSEHIDGPYKPVNGNGVVLGSESRCYATRLIPTQEGIPNRYNALSWIISEPGSRKFCGRISSPQSVEIEGGTIKISSPL